LLHASYWYLKRKKKWKQNQASKWNYCCNEPSCTLLIDIWRNAPCKSGYRRRCSRRSGKDCSMLCSPIVHSTKASDWGLVAVQKESFLKNLFAELNKLVDRQITRILWWWWSGCKPQSSKPGEQETHRISGITTSPLSQP
jgi:hypothetical protein